jgi:hypothetical protein
VNALEILHNDATDSIVIGDSVTHDDIAEMFYNELHSVSQTREQALATARKFVAADAMLEALYQYASDLRYPPTGDSVQRRLERVQAAIAQATDGAA